MIKKEPELKLKDDPFCLKAVALSAFTWLVGVAVLIVTYSKIPPVVPLFFSLLRGEDQLARKEVLVLLPTVGIFLVGSHLLLTKISYDIDPMFARLVAASSVLVTFLLTLSLVQIVRIVI